MQVLGHTSYCDLIILLEGTIKRREEESWFVKGVIAMYRSCVIHIAIQYPKLFAEVLAGDVEGTEIAIEGGVSPVLVELFGGEILVDEVIVQDVQEDVDASNQDGA